MTEPLLHQELARFVREARRGERMTQAELARLSRVGRRFISELESGEKQTLRLDKVEAVLAVFGRRLGIVNPRAGRSARRG